MLINCTVRDRTEKLKLYITDTTQTTLLSAESCEIRHYKDNDAILDAGQYDVTQLRAVLME